MNYWIISDTHFGHDKMMELFGRPVGFSVQLFNGLRACIKPEDILIHLGDVCFGADEGWHHQLSEKVPCFKRWLVLGNHDSKSNHWYLSHGWDFVAYTINLTLFGKALLFSHMPKIDSGYDINIHGHFHNNHHRDLEPELTAIKNDKQYLIAVENTGYKPVNLKTIIEERQKTLHVTSGVTPPSQGLSSQTLPSLPE